MTTELTATPASTMTWDEVGLSWDSGDALIERSWDNFFVANFQLSVTEGLNFAETYIDDIRYIVRIMEAFGVGDIASRQQSKPLNEQFGVQDELKVGFSLRLIEGLFVKDSRAFSTAYIRAFSEQLQASDSFRKHFNAALSEAFAAADDVHRRMGMRLTDSIGVNDLGAKRVTRPVHESMSILDAKTQAVGKHVHDQFSSADAAPITSAHKVITEAVAVQDETSRTVSFIRMMLEVMTVSDKASKLTSKQIEDQFGTTDDRDNLIKKSISESLVCADTMGRVIEFFRQLSEGIGVQDAQALATSISLEEAMAIADRYVRNADMVVSDFIIDQGDISEDKFKEYVTRQAPVGYREFREFIEGDYRYQDAIFKIVTRSNGFERAIIDSLKISVDLPDIRDSGRADILADINGTRINFNRTFNTSEPEVSLTLRGGTVVSIPRVISTDSAGFVATLVDSSGNPVAGHVSWFAEGY